MPNNDKDLLNQTWFHDGNLNNHYIKLALKQNGDFMVRKSLHLNNKYSLSICWNSMIHHLRINEYECKNEKIFYFTTKNDSFKLISELIDYHRLACKPVCDTKSYLILLNGINYVANHQKEEDTTATVDTEKIRESEEDDKFDYDLVDCNNNNSKSILLNMKKSFKIGPLKSPSKTSTQTMFDFTTPTKPTRKATLKESNNQYREEDTQTTKKVLNSSNLLALNSNDINYPQISLFKTTFNLHEYECNLINDKSKRLDRYALNEINSLMSNVDSNPPFSCNLSILLTKQDLDLLGYNRDYGLGVLNGLEFMCLVHGDALRADLIDRHQTTSLFIVLLICLCQIDELRVGYLILWIDTANNLFNKFKNFYAFSYVMNALNHAQVRRLNHTWSLLRESNEIKFNLYKSLNRDIQKLNNGEYVLLEREALVPNIYPISIILLENVNQITSEHHLYNDYSTFKSKTDIYLAQNAKFFMNNSQDYSFRCETFLITYYSPLFSFKHKAHSRELTNLQKNLLKLTYLTQTEFHQILLWSDNFSNYLALEEDNTQEVASSSSFIKIINLRINDVNTILSILSSKIEK